MYKIHVEIGQYQFVEVEVDSIEKLRDTHDAIKAEFQTGPGLDNKTWCNVIDKYLTTREIHVEDFEAMNFDQKRFVGEVKRHYSRVNSKDK